MELFIQAGWGMMGLSEELVKSWGTGWVILSPRDLDHSQLLRLGKKLTNAGGKLLLDPQFYLPRADHHRLTKHDYWPDSYSTAGFHGGGGSETMIAKLESLNRALQTEYFLIPGQRAAMIDDLWFNSQSELIDSSRRIVDQQLMATLCLSAEVIRSQEQISQVINFASEARVPNYYLILEHPGNAYFVEDPIWLTNALDLVAGLRKLTAKVVVGYANQQMLLMGAADANAIASGTWLNLRSFIPGKFNNAYSEDMKRKTTWYYLPQALSEYKLPYLDIAARSGLVDMIRPEPKTLYSEPLFLTPQPTASGWSEPDFFRHYLQALHQQVSVIRQADLDLTIDKLLLYLSEARTLTDSLRKEGIRGQMRDFNEYVDASEAALKAHKRIHGPVLGYMWEEMGKQNFKI